MRSRCHFTTCVTVYFLSAYRRWRPGTVTSMRSRSIAGTGAAAAFGLLWHAIAPESAAIAATIERRVIIRRTYNPEPGASAARLRATTLPPPDLQHPIHPLHHVRPMRLHHRTAR